MLQLNILAGAVNFVWNYVNELSFKHLKRTGKFFSAYDLATYTKGASEYLNLHSQTLQAISEVHAKSRKQFKKPNSTGVLIIQKPREEAWAGFRLKRLPLST